MVEGSQVMDRNSDMPRYPPPWEATGKAMPKISFPTTANWFTTLFTIQNRHHSAVCNITMGEENGSTSQIRPQGGGSSRQGCLRNSGSNLFVGKEWDCRNGWSHLRHYNN